MANLCKSKAYQIFGSYFFVAEFYSHKTVSKILMTNSANSNSYESSKVCRLPGSFTLVKINLFLNIIVLRMASKSFLCLLGVLCSFTKDTERVHP